MIEVQIALIIGSIAVGVAIGYPIWYIPHNRVSLILGIIIGIILCSVCLVMMPIYLEQYYGITVWSSS